MGARTRLAPRRTSGASDALTNALVGPSKLPAIHAFIEHAERQAEMLAEPVWETMWGRAYAGVVEVIGRFSRAENEAARLIAERLTVALPPEVAA